MNKGKFKLGSKVYILSNRKTDGRYNRGVVVGVILNNYNLYSITEKHFIDSFGDPVYKVAYVDVFTKKCMTENVCEEELSKEKPQ